MSLLTIRNRHFWALVPTIALVCLCLTLSVTCSPRTILIPRSQCYSPIYACLDRNHKNASAFLSFEQSWRPNDLACTTLGARTTLWQGSQAENRTKGAFESDNLGLDPHFKGELNIDPLVQTISATIYHVMDLSKFIDRLYVTFLAPLCHTRWDLRPCQSIQAYSHVLPAGYQSMQQSPAISSLREAFTANAIFGENLQGVQYQQIDWGTRTLTSLAGFLITCGRHIVDNERGRCSWYGLFNFNSSNKPQPDYLFNPVTGNGHFLEIGFGVEGYVDLMPEHCQTQVRWYGQGAYQYLLKNKQLRTFDLCENGPLSRYLLLKQINKNTSAYDHALINATLATTYPVYTQRAAQGQLATKIVGMYQGGTWSLGYQFYGVTAENICLISGQPTCPTLGNRYAIKGDTGAYAYDSAQPEPWTSATIPLNSTSKQSTLRMNAAVDTMVTVENSTPWNNVINGSIIEPGLLAQKSSLPLMVTSKQLAIQSGSAPSQIAQSCFAEIGYTWNSQEPEKIQPRWMFGGFIELIQPRTSGIALWGAWSRISIDF